MALETENRGSENTHANSPARPANEENPPSPPPRLTNFFIDEILKPDFGRKRDNKDIQLDITTSIKPVDSPGGRSDESCESGSSPEGENRKPGKPPMLWPAWVYCTRYSDRPSSGPRSRKIKKKEKKPDEKRPRTAFTNEQLARLKKEFDENRYLTESRRQELARELKLNESQIKIWFQNKRAKAKKSTGVRNNLAMHLMAQGLYNHSTSMDGLDDLDHPEHMDIHVESPISPTS